MIFCLAYELCCVDKMKLISSILASALVFHLVQSIVIKINPIRVLVRTNHTANTSSSAASSSSVISAQSRTTADGVASKASVGSSSVAQHQVVTDRIATEQSFESRGSTENEIPSDKTATQQPSGTESSAKHSTSTNVNITKYFSVSESADEYRTAVNQQVTLQAAENVSTIIPITINQTITQVAGDISTQYSNITGEKVTKHSSFWHITNEMVTNGSIFQQDPYTKAHPTANTTSKSVRKGPTCKIAYPISSTASKDGASEAITSIASTVKLSSVKSSASDIHPDFSPKVSEASSEDSFENRVGISSSSSSLGITTHPSSSFSVISDFSKTSGVSDSSTVDSEVQISAPISVKTATPHSEGYPDFEDENEPYELGPSIQQSTLLDEMKSNKDDKINEEVVSESTFASQRSSDFITLLQTKKNVSVTCVKTSLSPIVNYSTETIESQTTSSVSAITVESKLQETVGEKTTDSSRKISPQNSESEKEMQSGVSLAGEEDQIVSTIESYGFQESVTASSTAENEVNISSANMSATAEPLTNVAGSTQAETSNNQSYEISKSSFPLSISIPQSSAANISENYTTAFHRLTESSRATDFGPGNLSSSEAVSSRSTCKTTHPNNSSYHSPTACKTVSVLRTSTLASRVLTEEEKKIRRLTISNKNPHLAKKLTRVTPLKGNISSNAGFLMANRKYGARLFFWFVRSLHNSTQAPVIVWLQGQPGWSSLVGLFEEHGPYRVVETETGIQFELREHAWTNEFNVLYLDHCIGCGYSTAMRKAAYEPTFEMVSANVYQALLQFFGVFSEYVDNEVYLAGEHGCAKYIPVIADTIHSKNAIQEEQINLRGIMIGGPYIDAMSMTSYSDYLYVIGLIDEQEQENLFIREQHAQSLILATKYNETIAYLKENVYNKIEQAGYQRLYDLRYEKPMHGHYAFERYMQKVVQYEPFVSSIHADGLQFRTQYELLIEEIMKPVDNVLTTILQHYKVLYYNGQFDMLTPYCLTAQYFSRLHWPQTDLFYSSPLNNWDATNSGYPDGYWKFSSNLTHVMIRDAGHTVGTTKPLTLLHVLRWFVNDMFETSYAPPSPDQRYLNIFF